MVVSCCSYGCSERFVKGSTIKFYTFPKDETRRQLWVQALKRKDFKPTAHTRLCSKHFEENCFDREKTGGNWLRTTAVPTIFDFPEHLKTKRPRFRKPPSERCSLQETPCSLEETTCAESSPTLEHAEVNEGTSKRFRYLGDFKENDLAIPGIARKVASVAKNQLRKKTRALKNLQRSANRMRKKILNMDQLISDLQKKNVISESMGNLLKMLPPGTAELLNRVNGGQTREKYPPALRTFALTLNFYSSKAYNYVRRNFHTSLPHPRTLRRWYGVVDGNPGFSKEAAVALRMKAQEFLNNGKKLLCAMSFDEIAIRKHIEFRDNKFVGYVDYGAELDNDNLPVANEALTFMVTAVNGNWKLPIGYFLVNGLTALEKCNLVTEALKFTFDVGVEVISVTFDGTHVNTAMVEKLGASLSVANMKPSFKHPLCNDEVCIFLDPCHMLKLVRNTLAGKGTIFDDHKNPIKWEYILKLHDLQREEALHLATKIRMKHIEWYRHKMNVRIAAQTLSNSVANAIEFLNKDLQLEDFKGSEATIRFLRYMNNAFDCFNSRNLLAKGYKSPLSLKTANHILSLLEETETYIKGLRLDVNGPSVLYTNRKTGFLGFIVSIRSLKRLYDSLISSPSPKLQFLLTHKLLQDHVETFFSSIRRYGGDNNNPTATQFKAAYKRLLIHQQVKGSEFGTCLDNEECSILNTSSGLGTIQTNPFVSSLNFHSEIAGVESVAHDHCYDIPVTCFEQLSKYVTNVVVYISGFIVRKLLKTVYCAECVNSLSGTLESGSELLTRKNMGGLVTPSRDVVKVCKIGEQAYRLQQAKGMLMKKNVMLVLLSSAMAEIDSSIFTSISEHIMNIEPAENHRTTLIKTILFEYFKIRNHHLGKTATEDCQAGSVRSLLTKTILFKGH